MADEGPSSSPARNWITAILLALSNAACMMNKATTAGLMKNIQDYFDITDSGGGLMQSTLPIALVIATPLIGYLGDRFNRKAVFVIGLLIELTGTMGGAFMPEFELFLITRAIVGIGHSSIQNIGPVIISDMFPPQSTTRGLALFYMAIPVGMGMGFIVGQGLTQLTGGWWQSSLVSLAVIQAMIVIAVIAVGSNPSRGGPGRRDPDQSSNYWQDLKSFTRNKSLILTLVADACVQYSGYTHAAWSPKMLQSAVAMKEDPVDLMSPQRVPQILGICLLFSGFIGAPMGALISNRLRVKYPRADPLICGIGLLTSSVLSCIAQYCARINILITLVLSVVASTCVSVNWSINTDMVLYLVAPSRRASAKALNGFLTYISGDISAPFIVGLISDTLQSSVVNEVNFCSDLRDANAIVVIGDLQATRCQITLDYHSLYFAALTATAMAYSSAICYFVCFFTIEKDMVKAKDVQETAGEEDEKSMRLMAILPEPEDQAENKQQIA